MKKILLLALCASSLSVHALPTYEPFTEYSAAATATGTNAIDLCTAGVSAPSGETWTALNFAGTAGTHIFGADVDVTNNSTSTPFTQSAISSLLPATFPGYPGSGGITTYVVNPAQPANANTVGNSAVLTFAQDIVRPTSGTKTLFISYLFVVAQKGQTAGGSDGRYLGFLASTNLSEGWIGSSPVPGAAYTNWAALFNTYGTTTYFGHGVFAPSSSDELEPVDSSTGLDDSSSKFPFTFGTPVFVVGEFVFTTGGSIKDTNILWANPSMSSFGGPTPPASSSGIVNALTTAMSDVGGMVLIDRVGLGAAGGVGTNYIANLLLGSTWSYVTGGPEFTTQPAATTSVSPGGNVTLTSTAVVASQSVNYQWQKVTGGVTNNLTDVTGSAGGTAAVSGSHTSSLTLTGISVGDIGNFQSQATASGTGYLLASSTAVVQLADPQVTSSPGNMTVNYNGTATFTATATTASPPLNYQWYRGSTPISNGLQADNSTAAGAAGTTAGSSPFTLTLTLTGVTYQEEGSYTLFITNNSNLLNSSVPATLTVNDPYITAQPTPPAVAAGGNTLFTVAATGSATLLYQWNENGIPLTGSTTATGSATVSGAMTATLTLTGVHDADDGSYTCTITGSNSGQSTNSAAAVLTVQDPLTITAQPASLTERVGDHLAFTVGVAGGGPSYQWYFGANAISGATSSALVLTNIQTGSNGTYKVQVYNLATAPITSSPATLMVINSTVLNLLPANLVVARVGDGAQALSFNTGNTLYLDQYTTAGAYVDTIQIPDEGTGQTYGTGSTESASMPFGSPALIVAGAGSDADFEAMLTLSGNNSEYLSFAGYCQAYPYTGINTVNTPNTTPSSWRGLATVDAYGTYNLAYTNSGLYSAGSPASIHGMFTLDGTNFWTTGIASAGTVKFVNPVTGTAYAGGNSVPSSTGVSGGGGRAIQIINGPLPTPGYSSISNLVVSDAGAGTTNGLYIASTGGAPEPTGGNITFVQLLSTGGSGSQPGDFAFSPDNKTIYIAEAGPYTGTGPGTGGIERWDVSGSTWAYSYTLPTVSGKTNGAQGLTVDFSANATWGPGVTGAKIFATSYGAATNSLVMVVDNGAGSTPTVLATAGLNQAFRGVRFGPSAVAPGLVGPQSQTNFLGQNATFSVTATGSAPLFYQWYYGNTLLAGATQSSFTTNNISFASAGNYSVVVSNLTTTTVTNGAVLTVFTTSPTIVAGAQSYVETEGDHLAFTPVAIGLTPMTNYWYFGSTLVQSNVTPGATASLSLTNIQPGNGGTYTLFVTNANGHASTSGMLMVTTTHQNLSAANLVVARVGDGVQTLSASNGNTLYLDQYTTAGAYVNTIQVPDEGTGQTYGTGSSSSASMPFGSPALLFAGAGADAGYEAILTRSPNGESLNFCGYCQAYPFSGADVSVPAQGGNEWRGVAGVDAYGYYSLEYTNSGLYSGGNHQAHAAVDIDGNGTNFYSAGEAGSGFGVKYLNTDDELANGNGIANIGGTFAGSRVAQVVNGNLEFSDVNATPIGLYGCSGLPTAPATTNLLIAEPASPVDFAASPDGKTVYIADNSAFTGTSAEAGGIQRWDGTPPSSYTYSYTLGTGTGSTVGARCLTLDFSAHANWGAGVTGAKLYVTTAENSGNRLIAITDNGASSGATTLVGAYPNQMLAGVRFGPAVVPPTYASQPQNESAISGGSATFSANVLGSGPLTYQWYFQANGVGSFVAINHATNATYIISSAGGGNVGNYYLVATNPGGLTGQSQTVSFALGAPPQFTAETFLGVGIGIQLSFTGTASAGYSIWTSTDVTLTPIQSTWTKLTSGTFSGGTDTYTDPSGGTNPKQFYIISVP